MTLLSDLYPGNVGADLAHAVSERLVVARKHPHRDLTILNYTERCQYEKGLWSPLTLACRGLIHDGLGRVVARPFRKFFNYGQAEAPTLDLAAPVCVTDKLDGSLGILYGSPGDYGIATRGSFDSEQAHHAMDVWRERYADYTAPEGWTLCFEIIFPANRIVLDYGDRDDLVLLGAVEIATGLTVGPNAALLAGWPGPRAEVFAYATLADALAALPRQNAEGLVVHVLDSDERVKIKQEDYVALHRIVTGLNERMVWQHLVDGKPVADLLAALPDEFHDWVGATAAKLVAQVENMAAEIENVYSGILSNLLAWEADSRKAFALVAKEHRLASYLFMRRDGKDYRPKLWNDVYPAARLGPRGLTPSEETA